MNKLFRIILFALGLLLNKETVAQESSIDEILWTCDWSPDGKFVAVGGNIDSLKIIGVKDFKLHCAFPIKNTITKVTWHPTKNLLAVATQLSEDKCCIIDLNTLEKIELNGISVEGARGISWDKSGENLAVGDNEGQVNIYDVQGKLVNQFKIEGTKSITCIDWHPTKKEIIFVSDLILQTDLNGKLLQKIKHREAEVLILSVAWHKSGDFFVVGDYGDGINNSLLQFWSADGKLMKSVDASKGEYRNVSWSPKGNRLATASDALRIWDSEGKLISEGKSDAYLWGVSWKPNGKQLATSSLKKEIVFWNQKAQRINGVN
jgi:WD40 repeat protein